MGRRNKFKKREGDGSESKKVARPRSDDEDMMNDEIDAFHKQRDKVSLNMNEDSDESDGDNEQPVLDLEDEDDDDDDIEDAPRGLEAKIIRTQKFMRDKYGDYNDEDYNEAEEEEDDGRIWARKGDLHGGDNNNDAQSSDDEDPALEEEEVINLQNKRAGGLSMEDYGIENGSDDETDKEPTFQEMLDGGKHVARVSVDKADKEDSGIAYETVKKDLSRLTKEEQMDIVYSNPELVGLLTDLGGALDQLENEVNPLLNKIKGRYIAKKGEMHYLEVKQLLLQSYCQAITFFLLLKSEGHPVGDHPVSDRLVEIKSLLRKMKEMDANLPFDMEEILKKETTDVSVANIVEKNDAEASDKDPSVIISTASPEAQPAVEPNEAAPLKTKSTKREQHVKPQDKHAGVQSMEMLKVRAALEEKLKQKGVFNSIAPKNVRNRENAQPVTRQLETLDDFDDEAMEVDGVANHSSVILRQPKLRQPKKVISGDADIPNQRDLGERRRKYEERNHDLEVKRRKYEEQDVEGVEIDNHDLSSDGDADTNEELDGDSDLEYLKQIECQRAAKLAEKSNKYSRTSELLPSLEDTAVDGKRHITTQIDKNRGLTRQRNKLLKNPRKKYRLKHEKKKISRGGQVRAVRKPTGAYGGETTGINARVTRSVRFG